MQILDSQSCLNQRIDHITHADVLIQNPDDIQINGCRFLVSTPSFADTDETLLVLHNDLFWQYHTMPPCHV